MKLADLLEARYTSREPQYRCKRCRASFTEREMIQGRGRKPPANIKHCPKCGASHIVKTMTYTSPTTGHTRTVPSELKEAKYFDEPNQTQREADLLIKWHQAGDQFEDWWIEYNPTFIVFNSPLQGVRDKDKMWVSREDVSPRIWKKVVRVAQFIEHQNPKYHKNVTVRYSRAG